MYTRSEDDILPAARRRASGRTGRRPPRPARPPRPQAATTPVPAGRRRGRSLVVEVVLTMGALLGVAVTGVTVLAARTGLRPLVVRSGSMEPTIPTGSMVLVRRIDASEIHLGDIVAVERPDRTRVTHRVVEVENHGGTAELTMKGDANEDPDAVPVTVRRADRLVYQLPQLGRVGAWFATPRGGFVVGCLFTAGLTRIVRRRRRSPALVAANA